jgi:hypothetical protein
VLLGGPTGPTPHHINLAEEYDLRAKNIIQSSDAAALQLFNLKEDMHLSINPLGDAKIPYLQLPVSNTLQENLTHRQNQMRSRIIYKDINELSNNISS